MVQSLFEGKEAIYIEKGAARVRVTDIRGATLAGTLRSAGFSLDPSRLPHQPAGNFESILAVIEEIPTPGLPVWIAGGWGRDTCPFRCEIGAGGLTKFYSDSWSMGYGGWILHFSPALIESVVRLVATFPNDYVPQQSYSRIGLHINQWMLPQSKSARGGTQDSAKSG